MTCHLRLFADKMRVMKTVVSYNHNSVRVTHREFLVCSKSRHVTGDGHGFNIDPSNDRDRPAESAGDDEADDGDVEAQ